MFRSLCVPPCAIPHPRTAMANPCVPSDLLARLAALVGEPVAVPLQDGTGQVSDEGVLLVTD